MVKAPRPQKLEGTTLKIKTPCGVVYVMIQSHPENTSKPFEIFARLSKSGSCASVMVNAVAVLMSVGIRSGADPADLVKALSGFSCHRPPALDEGEQIRSCVDAISKAIKEYLDQNPNSKGDCNEYQA